MTDIWIIKKNKHTDIHQKYSCYKSLTLLCCQQNEPNNFCLWVFCISSDTRFKNKKNKTIVRATWVIQFLKNTNELLQLLMKTNTNIFALCHKSYNSLTVVNIKQNHGKTHPKRMWLNTATSVPFALSKCSLRIMKRL